MQILLGEDSPAVAESAWNAPGAFLIEDVIGEESGVWYGAVLRADGDAIRIGARSNIQDGDVVHTDPGFPVQVGDASGSGTAPSSTAAQSGRTSSSG